ncbi:Apoptosis-inducing factor 2 [Aphanomyces cochlioides]|nr:Apoptosis-inducing factor 2 [Aphanomyces cochlioides]
MSIIFQLIMHVVVVGGGYTGVHFAQELAKQVPADAARITLVEKNDFTFHCIGVPRALVDQSFIKRIIISLKHALPFPHAKYVRGTAEEINGNNLVVRPITNDQADATTTTTIPFDYLVLATGSSYPSPIKVPKDQYTREGAEKALTDTANRIQAASSVLIVGGGPVGIEVAGEIAHAYPSKQVTIVEANDKLLHNAGVKDTFRDQLAEKLADMKVRVVLGERLPARLTANNFTARTLVTDKGTKLLSDVQLVCAGATPNTDLVRRLDPNLLAPNQAVRVTPGYQVADARFSNIFVIGDANDHPTPKLAFHGRFQATHVANELAKVIRNGGKGDVAPFIPRLTNAMLITLGPRRGVSQLPFFGGKVFGDTFTSRMKGQEYFSSKQFSAWHTNLDGEPLGGGSGFWVGAAGVAAVGAIAALFVGSNK